MQSIGLLHINSMKYADDSSHGKKCSQQDMPCRVALRLPERWEHRRHGNHLLFRIRRQMVKAEVVHGLYCQSPGTLRRPACRPLRSWQRPPLHVPCLGCHIDKCRRRYRAGAHAYLRCAEHRGVGITPRSKSSNRIYDAFLCVSLPASGTRRNNPRITSRTICRCSSLSR